MGLRESNIISEKNPQIIKIETLMWNNEENEENTNVGINDVTLNPERIQKKIQMSQQPESNQELYVSGNQQLQSPIVLGVDKNPVDVSNRVSRSSILRKPNNLHSSGVITRGVKRKTTVPVSYPELQEAPGDGYVRNHNDIERQITTVIERPNTEVNH
jgi:hypothetical protein